MTRWRWLTLLVSWAVLTGAVGYAGVVPYIATRADEQSFDVGRVDWKTLSYGLQSALPGRSGSPQGHRLTPGTAPTLLSPVRI